MDFSHLASDQFQSNFPELAARFKSVSQVNEKVYKIKPLFGYWYNLCINAPRFCWHGKTEADTSDVLCAPHIDAENWAVYLCCIFIYSLKGGICPFIFIVCELILRL